MALATIDRWARGEPPPPDREPPAEGTPLFREIVRRQIDSLELGRAVARFYRAGAVGDRAPGAAGRARRLAGRPPRDRRRPAGRGSGSSTSRRRTRARLVANHQVVAYGYELDAAAGTVALRIYDPNHPDDDTIRLRLTLAGPARPGRLRLHRRRGAGPRARHRSRRRDDLDGAGVARAGPQRQATTRRDEPDGQAMTPADEDGGRRPGRRRRSPRRRARRSASSRRRPSCRRPSPGRAGRPAPRAGWSCWRSSPSRSRRRRSPNMHTQRRAASSASSARRDLEDPEDDRAADEHALGRATEERDRRAPRPASRRPDAAMRKP